VVNAHISVANADALISDHILANILFNVLLGIFLKKVETKHVDVVSFVIEILAQLFMKPVNNELSRTILHENAKRFARVFAPEEVSFIKVWL